GARSYRLRGASSRTLGGPRKLPCAQAQRPQPHDAPLRAARRTRALLLAEALSPSLGVGQHAPGRRLFSAGLRGTAPRAAFMTPDRTGQPGISIVIPSWNGRALLEKFLPTVVAAAAAFEAACRQPSEVVIADDASEDDTRAWLAAQFPHARFECSGTRAGPVGFAPTANRGVRAARYALVYVVNNDVALDPTALPPLAAHFVSPRVFAAASQVYDYDTGVLSGAGQLGEFRRGFLGI